MLDISRPEIPFVPMGDFGLYLPNRRIQEPSIKEIIQYAAFPAIEGTPSEGSTSGATPTWNLPTSVAAGEVVLCFAVVNSNVTATFPGSWVELTDTPSAAACGLHAAYLVASGGETTLVPTLSASQIAAYFMFRISGAATTGNIVEAATAVAATSSNANPPSLAPTGGAQDYLWFVALAHDSAVASGAPANYTNLQTRQNASVTINVARRTLNAATEDPGAFTSPADNHVVCTYAVHPAPAAGGADVFDPIGMRGFFGQ